MKNPSLLAQEFMEYGRLSSVPIIDMHTHMGSVYSQSIPLPSLPEMIGSMDHSNTQLIVSVPHSALFDPVHGNREIETAMSAYPDRIKGYFAVNPNHCGNLDAELERISQIKGFVGFKFLPDYHQYPLDGPNYRKALEYADDRGMLILTHTWGKSDYNSIQVIKRVVRRYKKLHFIMGHSIQGECDEAIELSRQVPNAYLELCDTYRLNGILEKMVQGASSEKILFGTDLPWYDPHYCLGCILFAKISDTDKTNIIRNNALRLLQGFI